VYIFASPETTDELCFPLETNGIYSCRNESEIVINNFRWRNGASDFLNDMETYRLYLINHETGHILGWGHRGCPKEGAIAPLMMQQSKGTDGCIPYGWPVYEMIKANFDD
jgi:ssRNA-specific RNase YbeY (16S rRNA maturation enzyme)